jgi:hypothetical protein
MQMRDLAEFLSLSLFYSAIDWFSTNGLTLSFPAPFPWALLCHRALGYMYTGVSGRFWPLNLNLCVK